jgi:hypothetical protein
VAAVGGDQNVGGHLLGEADLLLGLLGEADRLLGDVDRLLRVDAIEENHMSAMGLAGEAERWVDACLPGDADRLLGEADCLFRVDAIDENHMSAMGLLGDAERWLAGCLLGDADRALGGADPLLGDADRALRVDAIDENHASAMGLLGFESSESNHSSASHSAFNADIVGKIVIVNGLYMTLYIGKNTVCASDSVMVTSLLRW